MNKHKGFTLIEIIIVITILSIIAVIGGQIMLAGFKTYNSSQTLAKTSWEARLALEEMTRHIPLVLSASDITTATATQFTYNELHNYPNNTFSNNTVTFRQNGSNIEYSSSFYTGATTTYAPLAKDVTVSFQYLGSNGALLTFPVTLANIRYVVITLAVNKNSVNQTLSSIVYLRNLQ